VLLNITHRHLRERVDDFDRWANGPITVAERRREAAIRQVFAGRIRS
jgi:hypothetical protein